MKSAIRQSVELASAAIPWMGDRLMRATRPMPWKPHNDRTRSVFVHIPRTAGGSISNAFYAGEDQGHTPARAFRAFDPARFETYFSFAIVRNPFDRFVSAYHRVLQNPANDKTRRWGEINVKPYENFEAFTLALQNRRFAWKIMGHPHFAPQKNFVCIGDRIALDKIGRFETLAADVAEIAAHFPDAAPLGTKNVTPHAPFSSYYTPRTRQIVATLYKDDLALFGYSFD